MLYNMKTLRIPVAEARKNLAHVLKEAKSGARIKLTRYDKTIVGVVPQADLQNLVECEELKLKDRRRRSKSKRRTPARSK